MTPKQVPSIYISFFLWRVSFLHTLGTSTFRPLHNHTSHRELHQHVQNASFGGRWGVVAHVDTSKPIKTHIAPNVNQSRRLIDPIRHKILLRICYRGWILLLKIYIAVLSMVNKIADVHVCELKVTKAMIKYTALYCLIQLQSA